MSETVEAYRTTDQLLKDRLDLYSANLVKIKPKRGGDLIPFKFKRAQREIDRACNAMYAARGYVRLIILKARQLGSSTYVSVRYYRKTTMWLGQRTYILTHEDAATQNLFGMVQDIHEEMPDDYRPTATTDNANELDFGGLHSGYRVGTAKNVKGAGRSSNIQNFHGSEVAFWPRAETHFAGVMQAIPLALDTEIILESTANGIGGTFYDQWILAEEGKSDFVALFLPWFWEEEYRREAKPDDNYAPSAEEIEYQHNYHLDDDQIRWLHYKNIELGGEPGKICPLFRQEYPANPAEAFQETGADGYITPEFVLRARRWEAPEDTLAPHIMGVDVARGGKDKTRIMDRKGRAAGRVINETHDIDDLKIIADIVAGHLNAYPEIIRCYIDITGLGAGVYDILRHTHPERVVAVNFGAGATEVDRYVNKRAEIWGRMKLWFADELGADIPDDDVLHRHIVGPGYRYDANGRLQMEDKEKMKVRLGFSPDGGDGLALTFAENLPMQLPPKEGSWRDELDLAGNEIGGDWTSA